MSQQESCPGCQRAVIDVRSPVHACEAAGNGTPLRCAWRALQQQATMTSAPWPDAAAASSNVPAAARPAAVEATPAPSADPLAAARQQLAEEKAARTALREQLRNAEAVAAESQALRARMFDELERKKGELARLKADAASPPPSAPEIDATLRAVPEPPIAAPAPPRRRAGFGAVLLALGALAGIALGALGTNWMRTTAEPPMAMQMDVTPPASQPATASPDTSRASAPVVVAASTTPAPSTASADATSGPAVALPPIATSSSTTAASPAMPTVAAAAPSTPDASTMPPELSTRLQTALSQEGVTATIGLVDDAKTVTVADPAADRDERARTDVIIRSVFAGAQLPEPRIEHRWVSPSHGERVASAKPERAPRREHAAAAAPGSLVATTKVRRGDDEELMSLGSPAGGRGAGTGVPVSDARPAVLPFGRITASCNERASHASLLSKSWVMSECMRGSCCDAAHSRTEECQAFNRTYPLNCSR